MDVFLQQVLNGLTLGGIYGLVALGLTLVYGILHVPNFAHGGFYMIGAFVAFQAMVAWSWGYWAAMLVAAVAVAVLGIASERLIFHPLRKASPLHPKIASIGLLLFLEAGAQALWGADFQRMPTPYTSIVEMGGITAPAQRLLIIGAAFALMVALHLFLTGSIPGAVLGGLIIGFAESFGAYYISTDYKDIIAFVLLVVILSLRPQGLFAKRSH